MSYLSFGAGSLPSPIPSSHASNDSAMFSPSNRTGGTPKSDIFDDRGLGHVGRVFLVLLETSFTFAHLAKVFWSPTNIPKASRKVGPKSPVLNGLKWAPPKKIAYSGLEDFSSLATWATHWHPRSGTLT